MVPTTVGRDDLARVVRGASRSPNCDRTSTDATAFVIPARYCSATPLALCPRPDTNSAFASGGMLSRRAIHEPSAVNVRSRVMSCTSLLAASVSPVTIPAERARLEDWGRAVEDAQIAASVSATPNRGCHSGTLARLAVMISTRPDVSADTASASLQQDTNVHYMCDVLDSCTHTRAMICYLHLATTAAASGTMAVRISSFTEEAEVMMTEAKTSGMYRERSRGRDVTRDTATEMV